MTEDARHILNDSKEQLYQLSNMLFPLSYELQDLVLPHDLNKKYQGLIPMWAGEAGRCAESDMDRQTFDELTRIVNDTHNETIIRYMYWCDLQMLIDVMRDRLTFISHSLDRFYGELSPIKKHKSSEYTNILLHSSEGVDDLYLTANNIFVALASFLDLFAKVAYEVGNIHKYDFQKYGKMVSASVLYKKNLAVPNELKKDGLLFSETEIIRKILTLRSEYVHNGPWDMRSGLYIASIDDTEVEEFMLMPDMDEKGQFFSVGGRRKFYSQEKILNVELLRMINEFMAVMFKTMDEFRRVISNKTEGGDEDWSEKYISDVTTFWKAASK